MVRRAILVYNYICTMHALPVADVFCFQQLKYGARSSESVYKKTLEKLGKLEDRTNSIATVFLPDTKGLL